RNKGFDVYDKPLPELNLPENSFDIITMFDVIAHLKDPVSYIKTVAKILKSGGYLIIKTPYHSPLLFFLSNILSFTGKSRALLHIPAQIFHFNPQSLNLILTDGFKLLNISRTYDFSSSDKRGIIHIIKSDSLITIWQKM
ncbi:MAG TPA: methyltransferase domain-containing protein, partial [bacterium]|nr:methyltransferase domain-containing protein [bacterium]